MSSVRWIVRPGDGATVGEIVRRSAPRDPAALGEGRVFIGRRRARADGDAVRVGDIVDVYPPRKLRNELPGATARGETASASAEETVRVVFREGGLVVAAKPARIATVPDHHGARGTLVDAVARLVEKPLASLRVVSRLDVGVSGLVVFALDGEAEARLVQAREAGAYRRVYVAITSALPRLHEGVVDAPIGRHDDPRRRAVDGPEARAAQTRFEVRGTAGDHAVVHLEPRTGRTHQLRLHMAHLGAPLLGDRLYGGALRVMKAGAVHVLPRITLHARVVEIPGLVPRLEEPVPEAMRRAWSVLDGDAAVWEALPP